MYIQPPLTVTFKADFNTAVECRQKNVESLERCHYGEKRVGWMASEMRHALNVVSNGPCNLVVVDHHARSAKT